MGKEKFIKGKKIIIIKKIFKTIILSCIVLTFFVLKIPLFFVKIFYNLFSFKCTRQVYEVLYDNHNYDYRV